MTFIDPIQRRQAHGVAGEARTMGILSGHFEVLQSNTDRDGTDLIVRLPAADVAERRARDRSISVNAVIQSKFFEGRNAALIEARYALDHGRPRKEFFVILHTDDASGEPRRYFLTARDVLELPVTPDGTKHRFAVTEKDDKSRFAERSTEGIVHSIRSGILESEAAATEAFIRGVRSRISIHFELRAGWQAREGTTRYHLKNVVLGAADADGKRLIGKAVFAHIEGSTEVRAIDARWDLLPASQTWIWGYDGTGPRLLAASILGHYLRAKAPSAAMIRALGKFIASLACEDEHVVAGSDIEAAIAPYVVDDRPR